MEQKISIRKLISYLKNQSSREEISQITEWLEIPANAKIFEQIKEVWEESGKFPEEIMVDADTAWESIKQRHFQNQNRRIKIRRIWYAAACIFLFAGIFALIKTIDIHRAISSELIMVSSSDSARTITLPDQSMVSLNRNSQISYNAGFINNRKLTLTGEAFFVVKPDFRHPFEILSDKTIIKVVGTSFNVKQNNNTTELLVKTGKVSVSLNKMNVQLTRGEYAIADENEASIKKAINTDINYLSWNTGKFEFNNLTLDKVAGFLSDHYYVSVRLEDSTLNKLSITASFDNQKLKDVIDVINLTFGLEQKWISGTCYLNRKK